MADVDEVALAIASMTVLLSAAVDGELGFAYGAADLAKRRGS